MNTNPELRTLVARAHEEWRQEQLAGIGRPLARPPRTERERKVRREDESDDETDRIQARDNYTRSVVAGADQNFRESLEDESLFEALVMWAQNRNRRQALRRLPPPPPRDDDSSGSSEEVRNYL